ncbi:hypothetical protein Plhal304r1_c025g0084091 [Plasmopara halstedii]
MELIIFSTYTVTFQMHMLHISDQELGGERHVVPMAISMQNFTGMLHNHGAAQ